MKHAVCIGAALVAAIAASAATVRPAAPKGTNRRYPLGKVTVKQVLNQTSGE